MAKIIDPTEVMIGTAGWGIPKQIRDKFPAEGSLLQRYSQVFNAVEINSAFYKNHKAATYARWALETPKNFSFSVKLNKYFIHENKFQETGIFLQETLSGLKELGPKLSVLLIQLPPSLKFEGAHVRQFMNKLRESYLGTVAWEPRHPSWQSSEALKFLADYSISYVLADPKPYPERLLTDQMVSQVKYYRWHGSPEIYRSPYSTEDLEWLNEDISMSNQISPTWVIFDNTTFGYATENALELKQLAGSRHADNNLLRTLSDSAIS